MSSDVIEQFSALERPSIRKIKQEILRRAFERDEKIERGECDVPMHYVPLPVAALYDLLGQLEYRCDSLSLAVPPMKPGFGQRSKRWLKHVLCKSLRWLFIRQVEFNTVAVEFSREMSEQLASADRNFGEFVASVSALKLQVHGLSERLSRVEAANSESTHLPSQAPVACSPKDEQPFYQAVLSFLKDRGPVILAH